MGCLEFESSTGKLEAILHITGILICEEQESLVGTSLKLKTVFCP